MSRWTPSCTFLLAASFAAACGSKPTHDSPADSMLDTSSAGGASSTTSNTANSSGGSPLGTGGTTGDVGGNASTSASTDTSTGGDTSTSITTTMGGANSITTDAGGTSGVVCDSTDTSSDAEVVLEVDPGSAYQTIDGFGASDAWSIDPLVRKMADAGQESEIAALADLLFDVDTGIGLSAWRFNIGAGSSEQGASSNIPDPYRRAELLFSAEGATTADAGKQSGQVRMLQEAAARGVQDFVAFSNSPPTYLTKNGLAHPGNGTQQTTNPNCPSAVQGASVGSTNLCPEKVDAFAEFLVKVLEYLRGDVGVPVNYVSPVNEPTWDWQGQSQEGNRYNVEDIQGVYLSLHDRLVEAGLDQEVKVDGAEVVEYTAALSDSYATTFLGAPYSGGMNGSGNGLYKNYIDEFLGDASLRDVLENKISMHGYFSEAWVDRLGTLRDLTWQNVQETSPGAKIWMSEVCMLGDPGDARSFSASGWDVDDMNYALHVGTMIHRDLTRLNASAWHWWLAVTPYDYKDGLLKIDGGLDPASLETSKVLWTLGQFSRFIRPGFRRVDLPGVDDLEGLMASAYLDAEGSSLVVVVVNAGDAEQTVRIDVSDASDGVPCFETFTTDANRDLASTTPIQAGSSYTLPAQSIVTFRGHL